MDMGQEKIELRIRSFKQEGTIATALLEKHHLQPCEDTGFAPIGLDEPYRIVVGNSPVNVIDPLGLIDWKKVGIGTLSTLEGIQTLAVGGTAVAGTAILTKSPTLTTIVGAEMIPVFWAGWEKTKHGVELTIEGWKEPEIPDTTVKPSTCNGK